MKKSVAPYMWHGEPVEVEFGYCDIKPNEDKPLYWYNFFYHNGITRLPAIRVKYRDEQFTLSNHCGVGVLKLINGGWPSHAHYSMDESWFVVSSEHKVLEFDEEAYKSYKADSDMWMESAHPAEWEALMRLKAAWKSRLT